MSKVSVIIPTYNRAHLMGRAIQSVLNQTYQDFEIIVVDDASTDNTEEAVRSLKDERIRYIRHEKNKGAGAARNTGIRAANGEYIAFQDSDDEWLPEKLEKQMKVFENAPPEVGVVYTGFWRIEKNKKNYIPSSWVTQKNGNIHKELLKGNFIGTPATLIKRECFKKVGLFDEYFSALEDWELWIRISKYYHFKFINELLVVSYYTPNSVNNNQDALIRALKLILEKHFEDIKKDKKVQANHYLGIATRLCMNGKVKEGEKYFSKAFKVYPNIQKDRKKLSQHYFTIGLNLCSNNNFRKGRNYLIRAVKIYPFNIKLLIVFLFSFFGQTIFYRILKFYQKLKNYN